MDRLGLVRHRLVNLLHTLLLLSAIGLLLGYLAWAVGGFTLAVTAIALVIALYWFNPVVSPRLVLKMYRGVPLAPRQAPGLYDILSFLAQRAGLARVPRLYYVPSNVMNAFAVGDRNEAAIAVSDGLLRRLTAGEMAGVLAHEMAHISNNDIRIMGFADLASRATSLLSTLGQLLVIANLPLMLFGAVSLPWLPVLALVFAPTLSGLAQLALSRTREYDADAVAARLLGDPTPLMSALRRMERIQGRFIERILLPGQRIPDPSLLRSHPLTADRLARLSALREQILAEELPASLRAASLPGRMVAAKPIQPRWHLNGLWY